MAIEGYWAQQQYPTWRENASDFTERGCWSKGIFFIFILRPQIIMLRLQLVLWVLLISVVQGAKKPKGAKKGKKYNDHVVINKKDTCSVGLVQVQSTRSFADTYTALLQVLGNNPNVFIASEFDAVAVAGLANVTGLPPNRVVIFGNPRLGTPLIQADPHVALDLPHKMHVYETIHGDVFVGYNSPKYLERRYKELDKSPSAHDMLETVDTALRLLASEAAGVDPDGISQKTMGRAVAKDMFSSKYNRGVYVRESNYDFTTTFSRLSEAIPMFGLVLVTTVDHQAAASSIGEQINPTGLILFCFPPFDATFMQANQCAVSDFPLKMLVLEDEDGTVEVRINNFSYLRQRHYIHSNMINEDVYKYVHETVVKMIESATE